MLIRQSGSILKRNKKDLGIKTSNNQRYVKCIQFVIVAKYVDFALPKLENQS